MKTLSLIYLTITAMLLQISGFVLPLASIAWLVYLGEWKILFICLALFFLGNVIFSLLLGPLYLLLMLADKLSENHRIACKVACMAGMAWTFFVNLAWCILVLWSAIYYSTDVMYYPLVLFAYSIAVAPIDYFYSKEYSNSRNVSLSDLSFLSGIKLGMLSIVIVSITATFPIWLYSSAFIILVLVFSLFSHISSRIAFK